ncbi:hypothetical protein BASA83_004486 [Batrachochytrium salamandrivorans]|nr:hypothetical protein BASA81_009533 [Batrachochytrium salamandrivorans]KAH9273197.1 hypothetical protein BASA83_004486 [Batrachochytrium salamandrivorans]
MVGPTAALGHESLQSRIANALSARVRMTTDAATVPTASDQVQPLSGTLTVHTLCTTPTADASIYSHYSPSDPQSQSQESQSAPTRSNRLIFVTYSPHGPVHATNPTSVSLSATAGAVQDSSCNNLPASTIAAATDHLNPSNDATIVFALYASEYQLVDDQRLLRIVNIEKIDSSGSTRSLTGIPSTTIQAYIEYIRSTCTADCGTHSISNESSLPRSVSLRIHVFSRSQPQYLFPASKQHAEKRVRDDTSLVQWWMWVLGNSSQQTITEHARHSDPATTAIDAIDAIDPIDAIETIKRWWVIPGETVHSTTCARLLQGSTCKWEWGLCSDPSGRLPQFPDDPVSKACGMLDNNNHEVHSSHLDAVIDMLSVLGECQRVCAVLCLQIDSDPKHCKADLLEPATDSTKPSPLSLHHSIPQSDMKVFMASWMGFDFSSVDACVASSRQIVAMFHESFGHLNATTSTTVVSQSSSSSLTKPLESRGTASGINNLQGLVKRNTSSSSNDKNPTPSQTPSYTAQSIQGLVKRKPALSTTPVAPQLDHDNNPSSTIHHLDASSIKKQKTV